MMHALNILKYCEPMILKPISAKQLKFLQMSSLNITNSLEQNIRYNNIRT